MRFFTTVFMYEAEEFLSGLEKQIVLKILYNIDLAEQTNDSRLFKKLQKEIWEFRIQYKGLQIRLLAFWDKSQPEKTVVIATHGFLKKDRKVPTNEILRAIRLREKYFKETE
ncbi:MAG: type II toxin-antitoxin system RelE/ParE family toxin [Bacteroidetes bacterium]|nr:type II toxin-antitoxin system RelE/ParE family toxin [Bacteroidota bacterium]